MTGRAGAVDFFVGAFAGFMISFAEAPLQTGNCRFGPPHAIAPAFPAGDSVPGTFQVTVKLRATGRYPDAFGALPSTLIYQFYTVPGPIDASHSLRELRHVVDLAELVIGRVDFSTFRPLKLTAEPIKALINTRRPDLLHGRNSILI